MWLCTQYGFFSIVCGYTKKGNPHKGLMQIRARKREHLENLLELDKDLGDILENVGTDYPFRIIAKRKAVYALVALLIGLIDYSNFKNAAHDNMPEDLAYHNFLSATWSRGFDMEKGGTLRFMDDPDYSVVDDREVVEN